MPGELQTGPADMAEQHALGVVGIVFTDRRHEHVMLPGYA